MCGTARTRCHESWPFANGLDDLKAYKRVPGRAADAELVELGQESGI
ncbi:hypothetical protein ABGB12_08630 [Actinocorallia sp. B10E7]